MSKTDTEFTDELMHAHRDLLHHLKSLQELLDNREWLATSSLKSELETIRDDLFEHFKFEEEGGYMSVVVRKQPNLTHRVEALHSDHQSLADMLNELIDSLHAADKLEEELLQDVHTWITKLQDHEASENRLVLEVFNQETGGGD